MASIKHLMTLGIRAERVADLAIQIIVRRLPEIEQQKIYQCVIAEWQRRIEAMAQETEEENQQEDRT